MRSRLRFLGLMLAGLAGLGTALADEPCTPMKWDVARERALFSGTPRPVAASQEASAAPQLVPDALYELALKPQQQVALSVPPGKKARTDGVFAGLARLHVTAAGTYRISLAAAGWIDVVGATGPLAAADHAGGGCEAPHKVVQFELPAGDLLLQLSSVADPRIRLTLTRAP